MLRKRLCVAVSVALLCVGCASSPTWKGMSESQIATWRAAGIEAGWAQKLTKAGIDAPTYVEWKNAGIKTGDDVLAWNKAGFKAAEAGDWVKNEFDLETATDWKKKSFSATEAAQWRRADFDLSDAIRNREKGL